jgi:fucokinase
MESTFDIIVVTAPNLLQSKTYSHICAYLKNRISFLRNTIFHCVHDPLNARVGSGGGTLNAIDYLVNNGCLEPSKQRRVLIIHSGGDSRRSPLHSVCGKAWASLNALLENNAISSPLLLLLEELNRFCRNIPSNSVVVASSDVLLDINKVFLSLQSSSLLFICLLLLGGRRSSVP